jgi:hypothetical protein
MDDSGQNMGVTSETQMLSEMLSINSLCSVDPHLKKGQSILSLFRGIRFIGIVPAGSSQEWRFTGSWN